MGVTDETRIAQRVDEVCDLSTYLAAVDRWRKSQQPFDFRVALFRGQRDEAWLLKPGIGRPEYANRVRSFTEARMLAEFKERAIPHLESAVPLADADWLAIAQHHAMPTRLLDWTESALVALWFAIQKPVSEHELGREKAAAVWMLAAQYSDLIKASERDDPLSISETKLLKPRHVSRRIAAQDGWFSVHRGVEEALSMKYVSLDTNRGFVDRLVYIRIPFEAFGPLRAQLQLAGINRGVLFPDLEGVAGRITDAILYPADQPTPGAGNISGA
ncbi:FRG domain-containing protein [Burkholderia gladioli]|uniref:FRG domain-containing protein n=1 Tax=Burkholderia gladioli TaxID=28095 RepID=UPI00163E4C39|nr:FRG domain-containing protein [Burkholderia gladioli]